MPLATCAMRDLIELTILAKCIPLTPKALHKCIEFSIPILVIDIERDPTRPAREAVIHFKLDETLMTYLAALRAKKREYADAIEIGIAHSVLLPFELEIETSNIDLTGAEPTSSAESPG